MRTSSEPIESLALDCGLAVAVGASGYINQGCRLAYDWYLRQVAMQALSHGLGIDFGWWWCGGRGRADLSAAQRCSAFTGHFRPACPLLVDSW